MISNQCRRRYNSPRSRLLDFQDKFSDVTIKCFPRQVNDRGKPGSPCDMAAVSALPGSGTMSSLINCSLFAGIRCGYSTDRRANDSDHDRDSAANRAAPIAAWKSESPALRVQALRATLVRFVSTDFLIASTIGASRVPMPPTSRT